MITTSLYISKYDWVVYCYFAVDCYYAHQIIANLKRIGASEEILSDAWRSMYNNRLNGGLTYSNYKKRESVLVTQLTSSRDEFFDSIVHETGHLATHIAKANMIDLEGEEVRYIQGDIARAVYPVCRRLLCERCMKGQKH